MKERLLYGVGPNGFYGNMGVMGLKLLSRRTMAERGGKDQFVQFLVALPMVNAVEDA